MDRLVSLTPGRAFVRISSRGCGSGCAYCYISGRLLTRCRHESEESRALVDLEKTRGFKKGRKGTLLSLTPETEAIKSSESIHLVKGILSMLFHWGNPIQIPTKECFPATLATCLESKQRYYGQVVVFVSCSTISGPP